MLNYKELTENKYMKNKIKVLWFGLVPLAWCLALKFIIWITNYPIDWSKISGLGIFLSMSGILGAILIIGSGVLLAVYLQD